MIDLQAEREAAECEAFFRAANGDHDAQIDVANRIVAQGLAGELPLDAAIALALIWGHMAATSGRATHLLAYAGLLLAQLSQLDEETVSSPAQEDSFAMALAIVDAVADAGHSRAEVVSFALASRVSPVIIAKAKALKVGIVVAPLNDNDRREDNDGMIGMVEALRLDAMGAC